jgi:hypothetical protein
MSETYVALAKLGIALVAMASCYVLSRRASHGASILLGLCAVLSVCAYFRFGRLQRASCTAGTRPRRATASSSATGVSSATAVAGPENADGAPDGWDASECEPAGDGANDADGWNQ